MKKELAVLTKFSGNKSIPITEYAHIKDGVLTVTDLQSFAQIKTSLTNEGLVPLDALKKISAKNDIEGVSFGHRESQIHTGRNTFKYAIDQDLEDFPTCEALGEFMFTLEVDKEFIGLKDFVGKDNMFRIALTGVYFSDCGQICATDAHKMKWLNRGVKGNFIAPADIFKVPADTYQVYLSERYVGLVSDTYTFRLRLVDAVFPNYKAVIPESNPVKLRTTKAELLEQIDNALISAHPTTNAAGIVFHEGRVFAEDIDLGSRYDGQLLAFNHEQDITIGVNLKFFKTVINNIDSKEIELACSTPTRAMIINDTSLLMPVAID